MLPNFIVIGQAKCGTTSLCYHLGQHPDIFMSSPKEPHYFGPRGPDMTPAEYEALFQGAEGCQAVGEGSTSYTRPRIADRCAEDIHRTLPDCKLVYMVRDPMSRLLSDWKMRVREGRAVPNDVNDEVRNSPPLIAIGNYWRNLASYRELYPKEQILILFLEDVARSPEASFAQVCRYLGVDSEWVRGEDMESKNAAQKQREDGLMLRMLRRKRLLPRLKQMVPESTRDALKPLFTKSYQYEPNWDEALKEEVAAQYREWSAPLLEYCGKPADFWSYGAKGVG